MNHVLDHHDGSVYHHPEVDGAQAHQVGRQPKLAHADEGEQHRQWNDRGYDERAANFTEEQEQHRNHKKAAFEKVCAYRVGGAFHHVALVVEFFNLHAFRQTLVYHSNFILDRLDHFPAVAAAEHHDDTGYDFAFTVFGYATLTKLPAHTDLGYVTYINGAIPPFGDDDVFDVFGLTHESEAADDVLLAVVFEVVATRNAVVFADRIDDIPESDAERPQLSRLYRYLVLLDVSAKRVDFGNTLDRFELRSNHPVLDFPQFDQRVAVAYHHILIDLTQRCRDRTELGCGDAVGEIAGGTLEPLANHLPGEVDVGVLLKFNGYGREAELRDGAHLFYIGQAVHRGFDGEAHEALHIIRRIAAGFGDDEHLHRRNVGQRVDR